MPSQYAVGGGAGQEMLTHCSVRPLSPGLGRNYMRTPILALGQHTLALSWDAGGCRGGVGVSGSREGQMGKLLHGSILRNLG